MINIDELQRILNKFSSGKNISGAVASFGKEDNIHILSAGNMGPDSKYFIASVTKLFMSSIIFKMQEENLLNINNHISEYIPDEYTKGLHIFKGKDYSDSITLRHLLSHSSGLPDYFTQKQENGNSLKNELIKGNDKSWGVDDIIDITRKMNPKFIPGEKGKAFYSDTNFHILGKIIENINSKPLWEVLQDYIFIPLGLKDTYLYNDSGDKSVSDIFFKENKLSIPKAMSSFGADGGIVSTAEESLVFIKAFFEGRLFNKSNFDEMQQWNSIFFPFKYGMGLAKFRLPKILAPFLPEIDLIGHPGSTGSFAYYCPQKHVYICGTINQLHNPGLPYKLILKLLKYL